MIKPLILSSRDVVGGAARATYRLHQALLSIGIDSKMLVQVKHSDDNTIYGDMSSAGKRFANLAFRLDQLPLKRYPQRRVGFFSPTWVPSRTTSKAALFSPDIVNLHWVNNGFLRIESLKNLQTPLVWTMHDMWPFTGGCHYSANCNRYALSCGNCPLLGSEKEKDLSRHVWNRKFNKWGELDITIVALSNWLADCARRSSLFNDLPIRVIPNCIDTAVWNPVDKHFARSQLNLPQDKKIIGFGALHAVSARRKGFHLLKPALELLRDTDIGDELELAILGADQSSKLLDLALRTHSLGEIHNDSTLAMFYSAVDVFVLPSTEDNLPNTIMEALACGTPCVAFDIGGAPDMIEHCENGYLCRPLSSQDLAEGIAWVLEDGVRWQRLSNNAHNKVVTAYSPEGVANQYLDLYEQIIRQAS